MSDPAGARRRINWIASYPKSGNTWVRAIVDQIVHPERPFDLNAIGRTAPGFGGLTERYVTEHGIEIPADAPGEVRHHWAAVQRMICATFAGEIFLKTHNVAARFDCGRFPDPATTASAIYVVRDPRDVALSYAWHYRLTLGLAVTALCSSAAHNVKQERLGMSELLMSWGEHVRGWTSLEGCRLLVLRYEDLLAEPAAGVRQIGAFLGRDLSEERVSEIVAATSFGALQRAERARGFSEAVRPEGFFRAGRAGQWRELDDQSPFQPLLERFARPMRRFRYLD